MELSSALLIGQVNKATAAAVIVSVAGLNSRPPRNCSGMTELQGNEKY
jgi:hypothetical protein